MSTLLSPFATLSFPTLFSPKPRSERGEPVYSCALLFDEVAQKSKEYKAMQAGCVDAAKAKFGPNVKLQNLVMPFKDAGEKADKYQGYEPGVMVINPWSKQKPGIVDAHRQDVLLPEQVYAGQVVRAILSPFAWDVSGRQGVSFGLQHIQIVKHDAPRIDGRVSANKAFPDLPDQDELDDEIPF